MFLRIVRCPRSPHSNRDLRAMCACVCAGHGRGRDAVSHQMFAWLCQQV